MNCNGCNRELLSIGDLCFFILSPKEIHFIVKTERLIFAQNNLKSNWDSKNIEKVFCIFCNYAVGKVLPIGPNNTNAIAFGTEKVRLFGHVKTRMDKWPQLYKTSPYSLIEQRTMDNYFGNNHALPQNKIQTFDKLKPEKKPIRYPNAEHKSEFNYSDILMSNITPREYQITCYIEALQRDLVVVLPTGSGKTLIASMVTGKMKQMNPSHMVLFIVDRIPLVFQQGESLRLDTHLNVCCLCSETRTEYMLRRLREGHYDVLVSTAGAVLNLIDCDELSIYGFSLVVLDECHHATGQHDYVRILQEIQTCVGRCKPRIIGLTASPLSAKNDLSTTVKLLIEFKQLFCNAPICHNIDLAGYKFADQKVEVFTVSNSDHAFQSYIRVLLDEMCRLADRINRIRGENIIRKEALDEPHCLLRLKKSCAIVNRLFDKNLSEPVKIMKCYISALEIAELVGVSYANTVLADTPLAERIHSNSTMLSPRLTQLLTILREYPTTSKIIIFVHTRQAGEILTRILQENSEISHRFSPLKIFGHGGALGMSWDEEQSDIIQKFRSGSCNLLVSTSVLEEGLDVPACDVVIRFDGIKSLISFAQSKGRARKLNNSKFVLILSNKQQQTYEEIKHREIILKQALRQIDTRSAELIPSTKTLIIQNEISSSQSTVEIPGYYFTKMDCAIEFYITDTHDQNEILEALNGILSGECFLTIKRIDIVDTDAVWKQKGIFPVEDSLIICGVRSRDVIQSYRLLASKWDFCIHSIEAQPFVWTKLEMQALLQSNHFSTWQVIAIHWGSFLDKTTFSVAIKTSHTNTLVRIVPKTSLLISLLDSAIEIEISFMIIHRFILASWQDKQVTLFIPLSSCPIVRAVNVDESTTRLTCEESQFLQVFSQHPVLVLTLPYTISDWIQVWSTLHSSGLFSVPLFDSKINISENNLFSTNEPSFIVDPNYPHSRRLESCFWLLSVLKCTRSICLTQQAIHRIFTLISHSNNLQSLTAITTTLTKILKLSSTVTTQYFFDTMDYFNTELENTQEMNLQLIEPPTNYRSIEYVVITPSRVICHPPVIVQCSRLYRNYPDVRFVLVAFRDEQNQLLHNKDLFDRVKEVLENGFEVNGIKFYFLLSNPSQMRDQRAVFMQVSDTDSHVDVLNEIRARILGKTVLNSEIKFLSRVGLFSTSDIPMLQIEQSSVVEINDLRSQNNQILTDGSGKLSHSLSREVSAKLGSNFSAFQIRLAGYKGVLTVANEEDVDFVNTNLNCCKIIVRPSMKKMDWTDSSLNIVSTPTYEPFFINHTFINLITSLRDPVGDWNAEPAIRVLHSQALINYGSIFTDVKLANNSLHTHLFNYSNDIKHNFDVRTEPYFLSLLRCMYSFNVKSLISKARIPLENGGLFMGIPDPIGVLDEGEIFIQFESKGNSQIIEGPVILYKHPCLHPGDLLSPFAVNMAELKHLRNVVVFPIRGASLPASTSGGDLDGDLYAVVWESSLIPPQYSLHPALDYNEIAIRGQAQLKTTHKTPLLNDSENIQQRLSEAYCDVVSNDSLGKIANMHLALCDQLEDGACDPLAISVAELQSVAVDYPKTGVAPVLPHEVTRMLKDKGFPDFMEKDGSQVYVSTKLLGELYRNAKSVCYTTSISLHAHGAVDSNRNPLPDISAHYLYIPGCEYYMDEARLTYDLFANAMQQIMTSFGLETEAETVLGLMIKCHPMLSADKKKTRKSLGAVVQTLFGQFRDVFFNGINSKDSFECSKKVLAWYYTAYTQSPENMVFYSFPWIMSEYMCNVSNEREGNVSELSSVLGRTAREYLEENAGYIRSNVESKLSTFPIVESCITNYVAAETASNDSIFNVTCFGSVSLFLCEPQSDLDISINPTSVCYNYLFPSPEDREKFRQLNTHQQRKHLLTNVVSPAIDKIAHFKMEKYTAQVPIIAIKVDSPLDLNNEVNIDITVGSDGVQKCQYIMQLYRETGGVFYGWLWLLMHWARHVGILKCQTSTDNTGIILTAEFEALCLFIYDQMSNKPETGCLSVNDVSCSFLLDRLMSSEIDSILGSMLEEFFWLGMKVTSQQDRIVYEWPIEGKPTHTIDSPSLKKISFLLFQAWHCIVYTRDLKKIFERNDIPLRLNRRFSYKVSNRIRSACHFHELRLSSLTGATVRIEDQGRHLLVSSQGPASSIYKLSLELSKLETITSLTKKYAFNANKYILEGSYSIILENQPHNVRVKLIPFKGSCFKLYHFHNERNHVGYTSETLAASWKQQAISKLQFLLLAQLSKFPRNNNKLLEKLNFKTRFGFFYALESKEFFQQFGDSIALEDFERCLKKSLRYRRQIIRDFLPVRTSIPDEPTRPPVFDVTSFNEPTNPLREQISKKKKIPYPNCSFCPGLQEISNSNDFAMCQSIYTSALEECGFTAYVYDKPISYAWMMDVKATKSFDVRILLDNQMNIIAINERPLVWVVATVIADRNVTKNADKLNDIRLRVDTTEEISPGSNLYKFVFPNGLPSRLLTVDKDGILNPCQEIKQNLKFVRQKTKFIHYKRESITAKITLGIEYSDKLFQFGRKFCELTLLNNEHELRRAVAAGNDSNEVVRIVENAFNVALEVSNAIKRLSLDVLPDQ